MPVIPSTPNSLAHFPWPAPAGSPPPIWTGHGFDVGGTIVPVLSYETGRSGWSSELTSFHEETAGSDHPIDVASRELALTHLRLVKEPSPIVLEVGCSSGFMLRWIREHVPSARLIGSDFVLEPLQGLAETLTDVPILHFDLTSCPLADRSVDAVILLNVLEHIRDDAEALRQVFRILKPGGVAVIEVPAGPELFDVYDELLMHHRRYRMRELRGALLDAGFEIARATHLGVFVYPAFYLVKRRNRRYLSRDRAIQRRVVARSIQSTRTNAWLGPLFRLERMLGTWIRWPFGIRCAVAARRP